MPKPIELPLIDWKSVFESAKSYEDWMQEGEAPTNREAIRLIYEEQTYETELLNRLKALTKPVHVLAIAEDWCPDVVRHVPVLQKMTEYSPHIELRFITRSENLDIFMRFLTVGGEAIPKFIFLSEDFVECGNWGPMPKDCRDAIARGKACGDMGKAREIVFSLYFEDSTRAVAAEELLEHVEIASTPSF